MGKDASFWVRETDLTVARDKILINLPEFRRDIWMMQVEQECGRMTRRRFNYATSRDNFGRGASVIESA
jgi:hypothetical protein